MIAIIASVLLGAYVLLPDFLFKKFALNFREVTRARAGRFTEIFSGAGASLLPFIFALLASKFCWLAGHWPLPVEESVAAKYIDYRTLITAMCSDAYFHEHLDATWTAVSHVLLHQGRFLFWMYLALLIEIVCTVLLTYFFGSLSKYRIYRWTFGKIFLGRASHWQLLLTGFAFPRSSRPQVVVDAMTTDDHLYAGTVEDYFLDVDGELSGLLLKDFRRFKRGELEAARKAGLKPDPKEFWREIPGTNFYLPADKIANLNIRYEAPPSELILDLERFLKSMNLSESVTVSFENTDSSGLNGSGQEIDEAPSGDVPPDSTVD
jgi:hypothetical protein